MKYHRRRTTICYEGWYYLVVLTFIVVGAMWQQVNLLVLLAGILIGPLILNWRLAMAMLRRVSSKRFAPSTVTAGERFTVTIRVENQRRRLNSWAIIVEDRIRPRDGHDASRVEMLVPRVRASAGSDIAYSCRLNRRGFYQFADLSLSTRFPFGLVRADVRLPDQHELLVLPSIGHLTMRWRQLVAKQPWGAPLILRQGARGDGEEFYGIRTWRSGDSQRWIHWRSSAKLGQLAVRQYERRQHQRLDLLLDLWQPEQAHEQHADRVERAVSFFATAISEAVKVRGTRISASIAGVKCWQESAAATSRLKASLLERAALCQPGSHSYEYLLSCISTDARAGACIVLSTRSKPALAEFGSEPSEFCVSWYEKMTWIEIDSDEAASMFVESSEASSLPKLELSS